MYSGCSLVACGALWLLNGAHLVAQWSSFGCQIVAKWLPCMPMDALWMPYFYLYNSQKIGVAILSITAAGRQGPLQMNSGQTNGKGAQSVIYGSRLK